MTLAWYWVELGFDADDEPPTMTLASIRAARDQQLTKLKMAGAGTVEITRLHFAFDEARKHATNK
jgi:hypothetical protein